MQKTENYELKMPDESDFYNIKVFNENFNKIDEVMSNKAGKATTLAGYGITDAANINHTHNYAGADSPGGEATSAYEAKVLHMNSISDFNASLGFNYRCMGSNIANCPSGYESQWFIGDIYHHAPGWQIQRFNDFSCTRKWFERFKVNGTETWTNWHADYNVIFSYSAPDRECLWIS